MYDFYIYVVIFKLYMDAFNPGYIPIYQLTIDFRLGIHDRAIYISPLINICIACFHNLS